MTTTPKFKVGDRVRVISDVFNATELYESRATQAGNTGVVTDVETVYVRVRVDQWDKPMTGLLFARNEIELAAEPTLADTLRAKAAAKRAEAEEAQAKTDALAREWDAQSDRAITLRQEAAALNAAAKILETL